jgi:hypothetical protein
MTCANQIGNLSINGFKLVGHNVAQLWLALPKMAPLATILSGSNNSTSIWWVCKGSTSTLPATATLLQVHSWLLRQHQVAAPMTFLAGKDNHIANPASRRCRCALSDSQFVSLFNHEFQQDTSWMLLQLMSAQQHGLSTTFAKMRLPLESIPAMPPPTAPTGANGAPSAPTSNSTPSLDGAGNPIHLLQMFAHQVRTGFLAADGWPARVPGELSRPWTPRVRMQPGGSTPGWARVPQSSVTLTQTGGS